METTHTQGDWVKQEEEMEIKVYQAYFNGVGAGWSITPKEAIEDFWDNWDSMERCEFRELVLSLDNQKEGVEVCVRSAILSKVDENNWVLK